MTQTSPHIVDLNRADLEELSRLPYVGRSLAKKIIAGRPYDKLEDIKRVNGIGQAMFNRLQPHLVLSSPPAEEPEPLQTPAATVPEESPATVTVPAGLEIPTEIPATLETPVETYPAAPAEELTATTIFTSPESYQETPVAAVAEEPPAEPGLPSEAQETIAESRAEAEPFPPYTSESAVPQAPAGSGAPPTPPRLLKRSEAFTFGCTGIVITVLLSLLLSLGILAAANGGLRYARAAHVAELERQLTVLNANTDSLRQEIGSLRNRLDALEAISGRIDSLEKETANLHSQVEASANRVEEIKQQVTEINNQINALDRRVGVFDQFLEGLRSLLAGTPAVQP